MSLSIRVAYSETSRLFLNCRSRSFQYKYVDHICFNTRSEAYKQIRDAVFGVELRSVVSCSRVVGTRQIEKKKADSLQHDCI